MLDLILALSSGVVGGLIVAMMSRASNRLRNLVVLAFSVAGMAFSWRVARRVFVGESVRIAGEFGGFAWSLDPDPLGAVFGIIVSTLWLFAAVYSFGYMAEKHKQRTYYTFFLISLSVTLGVAFSGNLVHCISFMNCLPLSLILLVIHERSPEAAKAGTKYILYSLSGAGAILVAIVITSGWVGNLDFAGGPILAGCTRQGLNWLLALFVGGFGVKAAIMPLHRWLPAAMVAPTPVSALLHAVAVVYSGVYGILRVVYSVFGHELMDS